MRRNIEFVVTVRPLRTSDGAGVGRAWDDGRQFYSALDPRAFLPPNPADTELGQALSSRLIELAERSERLIRVADLDGEAVGFITATLHEPAEEPDQELMRDLSEGHVTIDALVVQQSHWRHGAGRELVEAVETWARDTGAPLVKVTTYANSPVSTAFYDALGYSHRAIVFQKFLD